MGYNITAEACDRCGNVCDYDCEGNIIYCKECGAHHMPDPWLKGGGIKQPGSSIGSQEWDRKTRRLKI